jgi:hypothetical protein
VEEFERVRRFMRPFWFPLGVVLVVLYWTVDQFRPAFWVILTVAFIVIVVSAIPGWIRGLSFLWKTRKRSCPECGQRVRVLPSEPVCPRCGHDFRTGDAPPQE